MPKIQTKLGQNPVYRTEFCAQGQTLVGRFEQDLHQNFVVIQVSRVFYLYYPSIFCVHHVDFRVPETWDTIKDLFCKWRLLHILLSVFKLASLASFGITYSFEFSTQRRA